MKIFLIVLLFFSISNAQEIMEARSNGAGKLEILCTGEELDLKDFKTMEDYLWHAKPTDKGAYVYMDGPASFKVICPKRKGKK